MYPNWNLFFCNFGSLLTYILLLASWVNIGQTSESPVGKAVGKAVNDHFCPYLHPQTQYCTSDFVIRAELRKIISERNNSVTEERQMKFKISKVYKAPSDPWPPRPLVRIHVYDIPMQVGQEYLLAGSGLDWLHVHRCDWVAPWTNVTRMQRRGLEKRYHDNCRCMISNKCLSSTGRNLCIDRNNTDKGPSGDRNDMYTSAEWDKVVKDEKKNAFNCVTGMFKNSNKLFNCYNEHAACYLTSSKKSCRWRTDDEYYTYCVNKDWLSNFN